MSGALLKDAEDAAFDAILTADQAIRYQQNRKNCRVALIVLSDYDESVITANVKAILAAIDAINLGALLWVDLDASHEALAPLISIDRPPLADPMRVDHSAPPCH